MVSRYGKKPRELRRQAQEKTRQLYLCPVCNRKKICREASGIWVCKKCGTKFASDAYEFRI